MIIVNPADTNVEMQRLAAELFEAASAMRRDGERIARRAGQTQARWQVMWIANTGWLTVPTIGRRLGITRQSVQRTADNLANDGLMAFEPNPDHATSPFARLTASGSEALEEINRAAFERHLQVAEALSDTAIRDLRRRLGQLTVALSQYDPSDLP
jgi:DNA-binding MarR family transcriptional regulator